MHVEAGHNETILMDVTFGTNNVKFTLFTLLVFDECKNGVRNCMSNHLLPNGRKFIIMVGTFFMHEHSMHNPSGD
jgi:hypothetical protein